MERYSKNLLIKGFGIEGQKALTQAKVLVVGAGGLGSPCLLYLASAGVGTIGIIEYDVVDYSNLQRQILYSEEQVGSSKLSIAKTKLQQLNSEIKINTYSITLNKSNARALFLSYDFIIDCTDNIETKYLINDLCVELEKPFSYGSVVGMQGQLFTYMPGHFTLRDFFGPPPSIENQIKASNSGILGSIAGMAGSIQATETIKYFTQIGHLLTDRLLLIHGEDFSIQVLNMR